MSGCFPCNSVSQINLNSNHLWTLQKATPRKESTLCNMLRKGEVKLSGIILRLYCYFWALLPCEVTPLRDGWEDGMESNFWLSPNLHL